MKFFCRPDAGPFVLPHSRSPGLYHIMLVTDELELANTLQVALRHQGYQVSIIQDGQSGLLNVRRIVPDLLIVSWSLFNLSGIEFCFRLNISRSKTPIILLTRENNVSERIAGFQAGANDCVSPPFIKEELLARIKAHLFHCSIRTDQAIVLHCDNLRLNRNTREVFRGNCSISLTVKEFDLLEYMMDHYFQVLTREQILANVWGYDFIGSSNIVEVYIRYLRQKIEVACEQRLIHTVRGVGYILREKY